MIPSTVFLLVSLVPIAAAVQASEKPTVFVYVCGDETTTSIPGDLPSTGSPALSSSIVDTTRPSSFLTSTIGEETSTSISIDLPTESAPSTAVNTPSTVSSTSQAPTSSASTLPPTPMSCSNPQLSCHNTTVQADLCCFNAPGGQLLLTQFWDTDPSTGNYHPSLLCSL